MNILTTVEQVGLNRWVKRDDLFTVAGVNGGKARVALRLVKWAYRSGKDGVATYGNKGSVQLEIVAAIAKEYKLPCWVFTNKHTIKTREVTRAEQLGATVSISMSTYDNVSLTKALNFVNGIRHNGRIGWIPPGMVHTWTIQEAARQVANIPEDVKRVVIPVGSGTHLAGVLQGLDAAKRDIYVVGVVIGRDPVLVLNRLAPQGWRRKCSLVASGVKYGTHAKELNFYGVPLDPVYEAHAAPHACKKGDLLWLIGNRNLHRAVTS